MHVHRCSVDSSLVFNYQLSSSQRFSVQAFRFLDNFPTVYLQCDVLVCHVNDTNSRCNNGCVSEAKRRRRETEGMEKKESEKYTLSLGPITEKRNQGNKARFQFDIHMYYVVLCCASPDVRESTKVLDSGSQHLDSGFQPFGFRIPTFWIPDSIPKWIPDSKPLWILDSGFQQQKFAEFRILLRGAMCCVVSRCGVVFDSLLFRSACVTIACSVQCV